MNIAILRLLGNFFTFSIVTFNGLVGTMPLNKEITYSVNTTANYTAKVETEIVEYDTKYHYDYDVVSSVNMVLAEGEDGIIKIDSDGNEIDIIKEMISEEILVGRAMNASYVGRLTGYGPDCIGCSTEGYVSCRTVDRKSYSLIHDGIIYNDSQFGEMRILAADHRLFPCGTVLEISNTRFGTFKGIVLDTGSEMRKYFLDDKVLIDLAYTTGKDPDVKLTTKNDVIFEVERWGW